MKFRNVLAATAALSLAAAPAVAEASFARTAPVKGESGVEGGSGIIIGILAAAAVIGGIIIAADGNEEGPLSS